MRRACFLDSSFWICLRDEQERGHPRAREIIQRLGTENALLVVTPLILAETHAYFCRAPRRALQILDDLENNPVMRCEPLFPADQEAAIRLLRQYTDKSYSFCDAFSFVIMRRLGLRRVLSFDEHFRQFGEFEIVS